MYGASSAPGLWKRKQTELVKELCRRFDSHICKQNMHGGVICHPAFIVSAKWRKAVYSLMKKLKVISIEKEC